MGRVVIVVASISRLDYAINQYGISKLLAFYFTPLGQTVMEECKWQSFGAEPLPTKSSTVSSCVLRSLLCSWFNLKLILLFSTRSSSYLPKESICCAPLAASLNIMT